MDTILHMQDVVRVAQPPALLRNADWQLLYRSLVGFVSGLKASPEEARKVSLLLNKVQKLKA